MRSNSWAVLDKDGKPTNVRHHISQRNRLPRPGKPAVFDGKLERGVIVHDRATAERVLNGDRFLEALLQPTPSARVVEIKTETK